MIEVRFLRYYIKKITYMIKKVKVYSKVRTMHFFSNYSVFEKLCDWYFCIVNCGTSVLLKKIMGTLTVEIMHPGISEHILDANFHKYLPIFFLFLYLFLSNCVWNRTI